MGRNVRLADPPGIGARSVKKGPSGAPRAVYELLSKAPKVVAVVVIFFADHVHQTGPASPQADDLIAFTDGPDCDRADGRIQARDITTSSENSNDALLRVRISHKDYLFTKLRYS